MQETNVDWSIHMVSNYCECSSCKCKDEPKNIDYEDFVFHTHGLAAYNNGLELELNLNMNPQQAMQIINIIGIAIKRQDIVICDGLIDNTLFTAPVLFKKISPSIDGDFKQVYRIVLSDPNYKFPMDEGCCEDFKYQLKIYTRH